MIIPTEYVKRVFIPNFNTKLRVKAIHSINSPKCHFFQSFITAHCPCIKRLNRQINNEGAIKICFYFGGRSRLKANVSESAVEKKQPLEKQEASYFQKEH